MNNRRLKQFTFPKTRTVLLQSLQIILISGFVGTGLWYFKQLAEYLLKGGLK